MNYLTLKDRRLLITHLLAGNLAEKLFPKHMKELSQSSGSLILDKYFTEISELAFNGVLLDEALKNIPLPAPFQECFQHCFKASKGLVLKELLKFCERDCWLDSLRYQSNGNILSEFSDAIRFVDALAMFRFLDFRVDYEIFQRFEFSPSFAVKLNQCFLKFKEDYHSQIPWNSIHLIAAESNNSQLVKGSCLWFALTYCTYDQNSSKEVAHLYINRAVENFKESIRERENRVR